MAYLIKLNTLSQINNATALSATVLEHWKKKDDFTDRSTGAYKNIRRDLHTLIFEFTDSKGTKRKSQATFTYLPEENYPKDHPITLLFALCSPC